MDGNLKPKSYLQYLGTLKRSQNCSERGTTSFGY